MDCPRLRRAIDSIYAAYLPKGTHPFIYLSLDIAPHCVDVNIHPTKQEVRFLDEDKIFEFLSSEFEKRLSTATVSRCFTIQVPKADLLSRTCPDISNQTILPGAQRIDLPETPGSQSGRYSQNTPSRMVRTDPTARKLDAFVSTIRPAKTIRLSRADIENVPNVITESIHPKEPTPKSDSLQLTSVLELQEEIFANANPGTLRRIVSLRTTLVGISNSMI